MIKSLEKIVKELIKLKVKGAEINVPCDREILRFRKFHPLLKIK